MNVRPFVTLATRFGSIVFSFKSEEHLHTTNLCPMELGFKVEQINA